MKFSFFFGLFENVYLIINFLDTKKFEKKNGMFLKGIIFLSHSNTTLKMFFFLFQIRWGKVDCFFSSSSSLIPSSKILLSKFPPPPPPPCFYINAHLLFAVFLVALIVRKTIKEKWRWQYLVTRNQNKKKL